MKTALISLLFVFAATAILKSQVITVKVSNIRNAKGHIKVAFFTCENEYDIEKPKYMRKISKGSMKNGEVTATFKDIPAGKYGVAVLDDENANGEMDYSFFMPTEGFGFSDYYHTGMSKPKYNNFTFVLGKESKTIKVKFRYII
jgi:uncharacterized protein (DUF2141 family)